ncbi:phosphodiester glycosidase family protein [Leptothoe spongobia]|uniref:Phosphodiester glycosidase family protein n=1 Tax=Leptothoe spongobia TAU-MAC 1115 TaxID=1967444 RepID=A0A947GJ93_9CYAN|nr:phosphodiester glycosidase family protein [Leptothoe spongobia]MBT9315507.1 phosphodiester glycosidase family protein [Leptothoe spongobia TAU-MAC 1115]
MSMPGLRSLYLRSSLKYLVLMLCVCGFVLGGTQLNPEPALTNVITSSIGQLAVVQAAEPTASGRQLRVNGRLVNGTWQQRRDLIGITDGAIASQLGIDLGSTRNPTKQPVAWFMPQNPGMLTLSAWHYQNNRYLDIAPLIRQHGWQVNPQGSVLDLQLPASQINAIRQGRQTWGNRLVLDLSQAAAWQVSPAGNSITVTVDAGIGKDAISNFKLTPTNSLKKINITSSNQRTTLTITVADHLHPHIWSIAEPYRLVIDIRPDALKPKEILWADGIQFQQRYFALNNQRFPVYSLSLDIKDSDNVTLLPLWAFPNQAPGIKPPADIAEQWQTTALLNGGFFNRNNQLPLGALRYNNRWISGPILSRGAVGWDNQGNIVMDRLSLNTTVTANDQTYPIDTLNSGYVKAGIARYTEAWGSQYTTLIDNEIVIAVQNKQVIQRYNLNTAGQETIPIPPGGYLLVLRAFKSAAPAFLPGTNATLTQQSQPSSFEQFPHTIGAGPLLITQGKIVLDGQLEGFSRNFIEGKAPRSILGVTSNGQIKLITIQDRIGGRGPTLVETAKIMEGLDCTEALNLDGGSSSSLYLGGQLINRHPHTAARINNALGIFLTPPTLDRP